jgi:hypothetical protein
MPVIALEPLGPQILKGFERPVPVFAVARAAALESASVG